MRIKKQNVYYCDFCKKHSLRSLKKHEISCTGNPKRSCRMCENGPEKIKSLIEKFKAMFTVRKIVQADGFTSLVADYIRPFTWKDIFDEAEGCPACMLATMRALGLCSYWHEVVHRGFDFKKLVEEWWEGENKYMREKEDRYY